MRVLVVSTPWYPSPPPAYGGIELVAWNLSRGLAGLGCEVTLLAPPGEVEDDPRIRRVRCPGGDLARSDPTVDAAHLSTLSRLLERESFDVISDHTLAGARLAAHAGIPCVVTAHREMNGPMGGLYRQLGDGAALVAISRRQAATASGVPIARVIPHGIDTDRLRPVPTPSRDYLLFLGSMNENKGVDIAVQAAHAAKRSLIIAAKCSEPHEISYFESRIRPFLGNGVSFVGEVGGMAKVDLIANAAALLFPTRWEEAFGLVIAEALSCSTPVIAFDVGAAREAVDHGRSGYIVRDANEMSAAVERLHRLAPGHGRAVAAMRFDYRVMARAYLELIQELVGQEGAPLRREA